MPMTEEEKREKLLKLKYEDCRAHSIALFGACIAAVISAVTLFANDKEPWWQIFAITSVICGFTFHLYFHKMEEFFDELEEMYAPKEKIRKRTKKERRG